LVIEEKSWKRLVKLVGDRLQVGRSSACQIQLLDPKVSRIHAHLIRTVAGNGQAIYTLFDGKADTSTSTNGIFVNGNRVTKRELQDGDEILFGAITATFGTLSYLVSAGLAVTEAVPTEILAPDRSTAAKHEPASQGIDFGDVVDLLLADCDRLPPDPSVERQPV
jgi:pSer/pThr/pTyr-binding forkhead associated (FHA) protein